MNSTTKYTRELVLFIFVVSLITISCRKEKLESPEPLPDFPAQPGKCSPYEKLTGYMVAVIHPPNDFGSNRSLRYLSLYAIFSDPEKDLSTSYDENHWSLVSGRQVGNLSMGKVLFDFFPLSFSSNGFYSINSSGNYTRRDSLTWTVAGNGSFTGFRFTFIKPFPEINIDTSYTFMLNSNDGGTFHASSFASRYDSLFISHTNNSFTKGQSPNGDIVITDNDLLKWFSGPQYTFLPIQFQAASFYRARVGGKNYQFVFLHSSDLKARIAE